MGILSIELACLVKNIELSHWLGTTVFLVIISSNVRARPRKEKI